MVGGFMGKIIFFLLGMVTAFVIGLFVFNSPSQISQLTPAQEEELKEELAQTKDELELFHIEISKRIKQNSKKVQKDLSSWMDEELPKLRKELEQIQLERLKEFKNESQIDLYPRIKEMVQQFQTKLKSMRKEMAEKNQKSDEE